MRRPSETNTAPTTPSAGRSALVAIGATVIVFVLAAVWFLLGRPSSSSASLDAPSAELSAPRALPIADESGRPTRTTAEIAEPGEGFVVPPDAQPASHPNRFSGRFVFEDG